MEMGEPLTAVPPVSLRGFHHSRAGCWFSSPKTCVLSGIWDQLQRWRWGDETRRGPRCFQSRSLLFELRGGSKGKMLLDSYF